MTDLARGLLRELRRRADQLVTQPEPVPGTGTVQLRFRAGIVADATVRAVGEVINRHRGELGLTPLAVAVGPSQPTVAAKLSLHGRPLAVARDEARVVDEVDQVLCRAPGLLLDGWAPAVGVALSATELADCGHDVSGVPSSGAAEPPPETLRLEVPREVLRRVRPGDDELVVAMRARLHEGTGVMVPDLDLALAGEAGVRLCINDVCLTRSGTAADDTWASVVDWATGELAARAAWLLSESATEAELDGLALRSPRLVEALRSAYSVRDLTRCLRELATGGDSVRNVARIVWLLVESAADRPHALGDAQAAVDPVALASAVRQRRNADNWVGRVATPTGPWLPLDEKVEKALLAPDPATVGTAMWSVVDAVIGAVTDAGRPPTVVVANPAAIGPARRAVQAAGVAGPPRVVAAAEVTLDASL